MSFHLLCRQHSAYCLGERGTNCITSISCATLSCFHMFICSYVPNTKYICYTCSKCQKLHLKTKFNPNCITSISRTSLSLFHMLVCYINTTIYTTLLYQIRHQLHYKHLLGWGSRVLNLFFFCETTMQCFGLNHCLGLNLKQNLFLGVINMKMEYIRNGARDEQTNNAI